MIEKPAKQSTNQITPANRNNNIIISQNSTSPVSKLLYQFCSAVHFILIDGSRMVWRHVVIALALFAAGSFAGEADVLDLTDDDFYTRVGETETTLVMFYAPW